MQVAKEIHLAYDTVKSYRKRIIRKMGARNIAHAVAMGIRKGWI